MWWHQLPRAVPCSWPALTPLCPLSHLRWAEALWRRGQRSVKDLLLFGSSNDMPVGAKCQVLTALACLRVLGAPISALSTGALQITVDYFVRCRRHQKLSTLTTLPRVPGPHGQGLLQVLSPLEQERLQRLLHNARLAATHAPEGVNETSGRIFDGVAKPDAGPGWMLEANDQQPGGEDMSLWTEQGAEALAMVFGGLPHLPLDGSKSTPGDVQGLLILFQQFLSYLAKDKVTYLLNSAATCVQAFRRFYPILIF